MRNDWQSHATEQVTEWIEMLASQDLHTRLTAIQVLGEIGDAEALGTLKARMASPLEEYCALVVAVGKLKKRLGMS